MTLFCDSDTAGRISDPFLDADLRASLAVKPDVTDVFVYSHGWQTVIGKAIEDYNRFGAGLLPLIGRSAQRLSVAMHWPSTLSEDTAALINALDPATFYGMSRRADLVGENSGYPILVSLIKNTARPIRLNLIGHSFGCKVVCSAMARLAQDKLDLSRVSMNAILLQAAFEHDSLDPGKPYADVAGLPVRMLITTSKLDRALNQFFPLAAAVDPLKVIAGADRLAMGAAGPTDAARKAFGKRLSVADLTPVHQQDAAQFNGLGGSHDDIFNFEVFSLVAQFLAAA